MKLSFLRSRTFHLIALGALVAVALFVAKGPPSGKGTSYQVVITTADLTQLRATFMRTWQREPTLVELRGLVESFVREEVLYREAQARGYDRDDPIVRRAMQRKMDFLGEAQVRPEEITEEEVRAYYALRPERYREPPRVSFVHVFFSPDRRGERAEADALAALEEIRRLEPRPEELSRWGDRFMLRDRYVLQGEREIRSELGGELAEAVLALEPEVWEGPLPSGYGLHLVRVFAREESRVPAWEEIRDRIVNDMVFEAKRAAKEQFFQEILQGYEVVVDEGVQRIVEAGVD